MASSSNPQSPSAPSTQRRASSVPNLREHPAVPQRIVPWDEPGTAPTSPAAATHAAPASTPAPNPAPVAPPTPAEETAQRVRRRRQQGGHNHGGGWRYWWRRASRFLGYGRGNEARKDFVTLVFTMCWGSAQIAAVTLLLVAGGLTSSPPNVNEWESRICDKPLGPWAVVWCIRVIIGFGAALYTYRTNRHRHRDGGRDVEAGGAAAGGTVAATTGTGANANANADGTAQAGEANANANQPARARVISRINTMTSFFSLAWFIVAHVFLYTSVETCRIKAPHLWWANFAIVCLMYIVVLEVLIVGAVIFILVPLVFLVVNIILVCMGRAPLQPGGDIHPEVPKLSQRAVDKIPLVLYIPPPPEDFADVSPPQQAHLYPPTRMSSTVSTETVSSRRSMFRFLKRRRTKVKAKGKSVETGTPDEKASSGPGNAWEDRWEKGDFPFVRLEENRAACAICLMDFEPPKKIGTASTLEGGEPEKPTTDDSQPIEVVTVHEPVPEGVTEADADNLRLQDAGEGVQPLRLLSCGHVFHKTCLDPWLVDVSGRCPTCQQRVDIPEDDRPRRRRRRTESS
ncbi:hypothetical protein EXIGLDRAFT_185067 [Exidia glandulosa HHB12029]|uniref:RING-type domain-containing protein n=1 Tax=Exidia glandulosa HHB12029 TaxID=1314781 RepID=A0A165EZJ5_EXIGL|nr:hypothetical protein EXIGLDRAFT_185067 [Exidia glandulosa HHB12029]